MKWSDRYALILIVLCLVYVGVTTLEVDQDPWDSEYLLDDGTLVCQLGALDYLHCDRTGTGYHHFRFLENGALVGDLGSLTYLLDSSGNRLSAGYHEIIPDEEGGYIARIGARVARLDEDGNLRLVGRAAHADRSYVVAKEQRYTLSHSRQQQD